MIVMNATTDAHVLVATAEFKASSMSVLVYEQPSIDIFMQTGFGSLLLPPPKGSCYSDTTEEFAILIDDNKAPSVTISEAASELIEVTTQQIEPVSVISVSPLPLLLLLLDEEAMYLCRKGKLIVNRSDGSCMSTDELWRVLSSKSSTFVCKYKVYEYYSNCSYVVKSGINFGVDYCLYQRSPSECHSEICITVVDALHDEGVALYDGGEANKGVSNDSNRTSEVSWRHITTLTRVVPDVMKLCIICYVLPLPSSSIQLLKECEIPIKLHVDVDVDASLDLSPIDGGLQSTGVSIDAVERTAQSLHLQTQAQSTIYEEARLDSSCQTTLARPIEPEEVVVGSFSGSQRKTECSSIARSPYIDLLFSPSHTTTTVDFSTIRCLESLYVHPVTLLVRRTKTNEHNYETIADVQKRLQKTSKPKKPKKQQVVDVPTTLKHGQHIGCITTTTTTTTDGIVDVDADVTTTAEHGEDDDISDKADGASSSRGLAPRPILPMHNGSGGSGGGGGGGGRKRKKSLKQRRDPQEVRPKGLSKSNKVFRKLMRGTSSPVGMTTATATVTMGEDHKHKQKWSVMSSQGLDGHLRGGVSHDSSGKRNRSDSMHQDDEAGMVDGSKALRIDDEASNRAAVLMVDGNGTVAGSNDRSSIVVENDGYDRNASMGLLQRCILM
jgi:hypothetical protein